MNTIAVFAGTFDPFTRGHFEITERAASLFGNVVVLVSGGGEKRRMFDLPARCAIAAASTAMLQNVTVEPFEGLLTDVMRKKDVRVMVRGLRNAADFDYERNLFSAYRSLDNRIECLYLMANPAFAHLSGSFVRELISCGGDPSPYLMPDAVKLVIK